LYSQLPYVNEIMLISLGSPNHFYTFHLQVGISVCLFWVIEPSCLVEVYWCFRGTCCFNHQGHHPDNVGNKYIWNVSKFLPDYMMLQPWRQPSSYLLLLLSWNFLCSWLFRSLKCPQICQEGQMLCKHIWSYSDQLNKIRFQKNIPWIVLVLFTFQKT
jgi:hypothetical protein